MKLRRFINYLPLAFLILASFLTRFYHLDHPKKVVFDEAHFGLYATKYLSHQYYYDIHPPFGKLLFGLVAFLTKAKPGFNFAISTEYGNFNFFPLRATVAFFGFLFVILIFFLTKEMGGSQKMAFLSAFFVLFDNAFLVQSRLILLDTILIFFIFLSLLLYLWTKKAKVFSLKWYLLLTFLGLSLGCAISTKLIGFGIFALLWVWEILEENFFSKEKKEILLKIFFLFFLPIFLYLLFFFIHLQLLPLPCQENCGEVLELKKWKTFFDITDFTYFVQELNTPPSGNLFQKILKIHKSILKNTFSFSSYPWESKWYSWPFLIRPICYFWEKRDKEMVIIYFLGNPLIWWISGIGFLIYFYLIVRNHLFRSKMNLPAIFYSEKSRMLVLGYLFFFLPFSVIPRFLLLYHYLPALTFLIILFAFVFCSLLEKLSARFSNIIFFSVLILIFLSFLYFLPLSYGLPLTEGSFRKRLWLPSWGFW